MLQKIKPNSNWLIKDNNKIIRTKSKNVEIPLNLENEEIMKKLIDFVRTSQDKEKNITAKLRTAVGLAAPQINSNKNMYYIRILKKDNNDDEIIEHALVNPKIIGYSLNKSALEYGEGCLSVDKKYEGYVERHSKVIVEGYDYLKKTYVKIKAKKYESIVIQHEQDHLEGKLYYDKIKNNKPWKKNNNTLYI